jgi:hypothetical protein
MLTYFQALVQQEAQRQHKELPGVDQGVACSYLCSKGTSAVMKTREV